MGKMKALLIDREEDNQDEDLSLYEEAHYHHVMNDFMSLIQEHGWDKVTSDLRSLMGTKTW